MSEVNVAKGIQEELFEGIRTALDGSDRRIVEGFSPKDITIHQRIDGVGARWHDARYLWMRLHRDTGKKDFGSTAHTFSRVTVVREDAVLEAVNGLTLEDRKSVV